MSRIRYRDSTSSARFLNPRHDETVLQDAAERADISVSTLGRFCIEPIADRGFVLGVSAIDPGSIRKGVEVLAQVMERHRG